MTIAWEQDPAAGYTWKAHTNEDGWIALYRDGALMCYTPEEWWADGERIGRMIQQYSS